MAKPDQSSTQPTEAASVAKPGNAHLSRLPEVNFEGLRVKPLEGKAIALVCPVTGAYSGTLSLRLDMTSARTYASSLRYWVLVENPQVPTPQWLTEQGLEAVAAKLAAEPPVEPSAAERRAVARARRRRMRAVELVG